MEPLKKAHGVCPNCGATIAGMNQETFQAYYGSPIQRCRRCKGEYLDPRYHEIAVDGLDERTLSVKHTLKALGICLGLFAACTGWNLFNIFTSGGYYPVFAILSLAMLATAVYLLVDIIRIKTGAKAKSMEKKRLESVARLQDPDYARRLYEAGYPVPREYLPPDVQ